MDLPGTLDTRDVVYLIAGTGLLGLTLRPALSRFPLVNVPLFYVVAGILLALIGLPALDPRSGGLSSAMVEHASELIVIISLAGAGLAIDAPETWRNWGAAYRLLLISMPLTIATVAILGWAWLGLPLAAAMLLGASLAPTDPVLARSVEVGPPGGGDEPMQLALTAEAGLNDGLAFPFVYLAIILASLGAGADASWLPGWLGFHVLYRVAAGIALGYVLGRLISRLVMSRFGDASFGARNSIVVVLAATLLSYGAAEAIDAYGFLAVFAACRGGRAHTRGTDDAGYERFVHHGAEQLETILLALLLIWFGMFVGAGALQGATWREAALALLIVLAIRPLTGRLSLLGHPCTQIERWQVAFFGVRGMGTIFYIAYAQNHGAFESVDAVWRIASMTILISMAVHGFGANFVVKSDDDEASPFADLAARQRE